MQYFNLKDPAEQVSFSRAITQGLGRNQGLFFPHDISKVKDIASLLSLPFGERNVEILYPFLCEDLSKEAVTSIVHEVFNFPATLQPINNDCAVLELFHGPTLAFKDFGARFMALCLQQLMGDEKVTILTATSGDTGAAVAQAFHKIDNIRVVVLYPKGKISLLQEKMFTTLGDNIETIAVNGTFDDCQALVKQSFDDPNLVQKIGLNSANSINISRLLAQVCYYFEAFHQLSSDVKGRDIVLSVPSGNFGNLTAGFMAKAMGLPIKRFIAATNSNDTVPRYLVDQKWSPNPTIETSSNAMDVSNPNNWPRIEYMMDKDIVDGKCLSATAIDDPTTKATMAELNALGYVSEPHAAVAFKGLENSLDDNEYGIFLGTAHPAKFKDVVDSVLKTDIALPKALLDCKDKKILSSIIEPDFSALRDQLLGK